MSQRLAQRHDERQDYETPPSVVAEMSAKFGPFTVDVAATEANKKVPRCFTPEMDGLSLSWTGEVCWMNPPYGRATSAWVRKAATEQATTVCLLPARTDTRWFHAYVWDKEKKAPRPNVAFLDFLPGRIKFLIDGKPVLALDKKSGKWRPAAGKFPSIIVVFSNVNVSPRKGARRMKGVVPRCQRCAFTQGHAKWCSDLARELVKLDAFNAGVRRYLEDP